MHACMHARMHAHTHARTYTHSQNTHAELPSYPLYKFSKVVWTGDEFKQSSVRNVVTIAT